MKRILIILLLIIAVSGFGATYYVRTDGNDGNTGLANADSTAWLTINSAHTQASDTDTVYVNAGTYASVELGTYGIALNPIKAIKFIAVGTVTIQGATGATTAPLRLAGATKALSFTGFTFTTAIVGGGTAGTTLYLNSDAHGATFTNCIMDCGTTRGILLLGDDYTFENCTITGASTDIIDDRGEDNTVNNCTITATPSAAVFVTATGGGTNTYTNNTITPTTAVNVFELVASADYVLTGNTISGMTSTTNLILAKTGTGAITISNETYTMTALNPAQELFSFRNGTWTVTVDDCIFSFTGSVLDDNILEFYDQPAPMIRGNTFTTDTTNNITHISLQSSGSASGVPQIKNNVFYTKSEDNYTVIVGTDASGAGDNDFDGVIITGNAMYGADYYDPTADSANHGFLVGHNINAVIANNYANGTGMGIAVKSEGLAYTSGGIYNNVVINCAYAGILVKGVQDVPVYNNTTIYTNQTLSSAGINVYKNEALGNSDDCILKNNIIYSTAPAANFTAILIGAEEFAAGFTIDYNDIFSTTGTGFRARADDTTYTSLATWQTKLSDAANSINVNPKLADNYSLKFSSPCKGAGVTLAATYDDQMTYNATFPNPDLIQQSGDWNMGAFGTSKGGNRRRRR